MPTANSIVMLGATGAVGNHIALALAKMRGVGRLTLLGRRPVENIVGKNIEQHSVDIFSASSYQALLVGHNAAICTLGVGEPSKMSKAEFVKIDRDAVLAFAKACKRAGVSHFELLSAVGANPRSASFYLRTKGELEEGIKALNFDRLSLFQPSMIITPENRYGLSQAVLLTAMPMFDPLLVGPMRKFRSILVEQLGAAIAVNVFNARQGVETLHWDEFAALANK